jgi:hypothetical protein
VIATAIVESSRPARVITAKGVTSTFTERRPRLPHTHRRLSSNEGIVATAVATTLAAAAPVACVATRLARMVWATVVDTTETAA